MSAARPLNSEEDFENSSPQSEEALGLASEASSEHMGHTGPAVGVEEVLVHYPDPTPLIKVLRDVASWSGLNFIVDPNLGRGKPVFIQIIAPQPVSKEDGFEMFSAALAMVQLRMYQEGSMVKVVRSHIYDFV